MAAPAQTNEAPLGFSVLLYKAWSQDLQGIHACSFQVYGIQEELSFSLLFQRVK